MVMLLLDACYIGQGGNQLVAAVLERLGATWGRSSGAGLAVVSSAQPHQQAAAGLFPQLLSAAVTDLSVAGHGSGTLSVNAVVQHMNGSKDRPGNQWIGLSTVGLDGDPPAFFPNPRHDVRLNEVDLAQQAAAFDHQDQRRETEFTSRLLVRAMGDQGRLGDDLTAPAWWFSGCHYALHDLATWLNTTDSSDETACRVITAAPGSGKTAVLGLVSALAHPERRLIVPLDALGLPQDLLAPDTVDVAVYAQRLTDTDVLDAVAAAARIRIGTVGELLDALGHRERPLTVVIDALDETAPLCTTVLRPLIEHARGRIRLLLGTPPLPPAPPRHRLRRHRPGHRPRQPPLRAPQSPHHLHRPHPPPGPQHLPLPQAPPSSAAGRPRRRRRHPRRLPHHPRPHRPDLACLPAPPRRRRHARGPPTTPR
ncbi:hypothetical protein ACFV30_39745 [Streptomyces sp. NPDC059752]|uniref:hypothetical protein n=1 Tax=unclassified Streptomyces TaxID=2593676 RepID=UPI0036488906